MTPAEQLAALPAPVQGRLWEIDPENTSAILAQGGDAAQVWAAAQDATKGIQRIRQVWKAALARRLLETTKELEALGESEPEPPPTADVAFDPGTV